MTTFSEMLAKAMSEKKPRRKPRELEHQLQVACVKWFRLRYPQFAKSLFAVPNGGWRNEAVAAKLKAEGVLAGVADLLLLEANWEYRGLAIELKTQEGRQSKAQEEWQRYITGRGWEYVIVRSVEQFIEVVEEYMEH